MLSLGYSLPTLGQVAALVFLPFAGWYVDQPMGVGATARMLLTAIPSSVAGLKAVIRQELLRQGLPLPLLDLVYLNGDWLYRFEKVLALFGIVALALLVHFRAIAFLRLRLLPLLAGLVLSLAVGVVMVGGSRVLLLASLGDSYRNDEKLMALQPLLPAPAPAPLRDPQLAVVTLAALRRRGVLRLGVRQDGMPWAYRNASGRIVGYGIDLMQAFAASLGLRLEVLEAPLEQLSVLLDQERIDLAVGGIQASPLRAVRHSISRGYELVHLALVVPDAKVGWIQTLERHRSERPVRIAAADPQVLSSALENQLSAELGGAGNELDLQLEPIASRSLFFLPAVQQRFDALLTTAEGGSAWAVLHPDTTLLPLFGDRIENELVVLVGGDDGDLISYLNSWLGQGKARGLMERLFVHWIRVES